MKFRLGILFACMASQAHAASLSPADAAKIQRLELSGFSDPQIYTVDPSANVSGVHLGSELRVLITEGLRKDGYEIADAANTAAADATLDLTILGAPPRQGPGFGPAHGSFGRAEPEFAASITLRDKATGKELFHKLFLYHHAFFGPLDGSMLIEPDPKYSGDLAHAADSFRAGEALVADAIAASLKRPPATP